ncbi:MAG TPA: hypothetical protein VKV96_20865 [Roseiarcus sp.]|nr:hypothetical protein [Roseiarcus sp.]
MPETIKVQRVDGFGRTFTLSVGDQVVAESLTAAEARLLVREMLERSSLSKSDFVQIRIQLHPQRGGEPGTA